MKHNLSRLIELKKEVGVLHCLLSSYQSEIVKKNGCIICNRRCYEMYG